MGDSTPKDGGHIHWRHPSPREWKICPLCGNALEDHQWDGRNRRFCSQCGFVYWERPNPAVAAIIFDRAQQKVLLVSRRFPPSAGGLILPGGGIELGESLSNALFREIDEETGLQIAIDRQLGTWSTDTNETIVTVYVVHPTGGDLRPGSDALDAVWFSVAHLPQLSFETHHQALNLFAHYVTLGEFGGI